MEINPAFNKYMGHYFEFEGHWGSPSKCGLRIVHRKDGKVLAIATELYRQNPGTPVTEWCAPLATQIFRSLDCQPEDFIFVEHTPDLKSKLIFYQETFDRLDFDWTDGNFVRPRWSRLRGDQVDQMMGD